MTPEELIADLRSRINPIYASQIGTESHERRICAEALEAQEKKIEQLQTVLRQVLMDAQSQDVLWEWWTIMQEALDD